MVNSLIMVKILVNSQNQDVYLEIDNFVFHIDDLLNVNSQMISNASINNLLLLTNCKNDFQFNSMFYITLINFRLDNYQNYSKEKEIQQFDQFLDANENKIFQRAILHFKIITILA